MNRSIRTMLDAVTNFGKVTVSTGYTSLDMVIVLISGDGTKLPNPSIDGQFNLTWWNSTDYTDPADDPNKEIVRVTARIGDTLTLTRAQEGTSASIKNLSGKTYKMILAVTAKMIPDIQSDAQTRADTTVENHRLTGIHALPQPVQIIPNRSSFTARVVNAPTAGAFLPDITIPDGFYLVLRATIGNIGQVYIADSIPNATSSAIPGNRNTLNAGDVVKLYVSNANIVAIAGSVSGITVDILVEQ